jgi:hypothetical protein
MESGALYWQRARTKYKNMLKLLYLPVLMGSQAIILEWAMSKTTNLMG